MKKVILSVLIVIGLLVPMVLTGCSGSSEGDVITEKKAFQNFNAVEIDSAFDFNVTWSDTWEVTISAHESLFDYIEVTQSGTTLKIKLSPHHIFTNFMLGTRDLKAEITMPNLNALTVSGACSGDVSGFSSASNMLLNVSGASNVDLKGMTLGGLSGEIAGASEVTGNVTATSVALEVSGASTLDIAGSATNLDVIVSGASKAELESFIAANVDAAISGASTATVYAGQTLDVSVSGASSLYFVGNPTLGESSVSGASTIQHKESKD